MTKVSGYFITMDIAEPQAKRDEVVRQILRLLPIQIRGAFAKNLVCYSSFPAFLVTFFSDLLNRPKTEAGTEDVLAGVTECMYRMCTSQWEGSSKSICVGGSILADEFLEPLLVRIPEIRSFAVLVQQKYMQILLEIFKNSPQKVDCLLAHDELCKYLFYDYMASCGDSLLQEHIVRILLCCADKNAGLTKRFVNNEEVRTWLHQMRGCNPTFQKLHPVILPFNINKSQARSSDTNPAPQDLEGFPIAEAGGAAVRGVKRARGADADGPESARDPIKRIKVSELDAISLFQP